MDTNKDKDTLIALVLTIGILAFTFLIYNASRKEACKEAIKYGNQTAIERVCK